ncbi:hypothetical protein ADK74_22640 [Streptomyces decoyicus]|nr:hypothetical protein ADK74_22640 [Streptomyces decoyicus]
MIVGVATAVVGGFLALSNGRASAASPERDSYADSYDPFEHPHWTKHAGGYYVCRHKGCSKKANPTITAHDCCGRCWPGRCRLRRGSP